MTKMTLTIMTTLTDTRCLFRTIFFSKNLERNNKITIFA